MLGAWVGLLSLCLAGLGLVGWVRWLARNKRKLDRRCRGQSVDAQLLRYLHVVGLGEVMQFTAARLLVFGGRSGDASEKPCWNTHKFIYSRVRDEITRVYVRMNGY